MRERIGADPGGRARPAAGLRERFARQLQELLAASQWWPAEEMRQKQLQQLQPLLDHAAATVPFYGERLRAAGHRPGAPIDRALWSRIPVLTRSELQVAGATLESRAVPPAHGYIRTRRTSGSTGVPVVAKVTALSEIWFRAIMLREQLWHRRDFAGTYAVIRKFKTGIAPPPDGVRRERWAGRSAIPWPTGPSLRLNITTAVEQQVEWLQRHDPHYLLTFPSNLAALVRAHQATGLQLTRLREVVTLGELLPAETRQLVQDAWGVPIRDTYSAKEIGYIALQCPQQAHFHVQSEVVLVEVLDAEGRACAPGETGRVVLTPLHNFAMPLVRYEIGDHAEVGAPCACGRGLPVLTRIMGRVRNILIGPSGRRYWPSFGAGNFREIAPVSRHQFVQHSRTELEARLVVERPLTEAETAKFRAHLLSRLPEPLEIRFVFVDDIPPSAGGKLENFICRVDG